MQIAYNNSRNATQPFATTQLSDPLGGEIYGLDLSKPIDAEMKEAIYNALLQYLSLIHI